MLLILCIGANVRGESLCCLLALVRPSLLPPARCGLEDTARTSRFRESSGAQTPGAGSVVPKRCLVTHSIALSERLSRGTKCCLLAKKQWRKSLLWAYPLSAMWCLKIALGKSDGQSGRTGLAVRVSSRCCCSKGCVHEGTCIKVDV